jgi:hypothetical protein
MTEPIQVKILPEQVDVTKLIVNFAITGSLAIALIWIQRKASSPDFVLTQKMRVLHGVATYADARARFWEQISAGATKLYLESRP